MTIWEKDEEMLQSDFVLYFMEILDCLYSLQ